MLLAFLVALLSRWQSIYQVVYEVSAIWKTPNGVLRTVFKRGVNKTARTSQCGWAAIWSPMMHEHLGVLSAPPTWYRYKNVPCRIREKQNLDATALFLLLHEASCKCRRQKKLVSAISYISSQQSAVNDTHHVGRRWCFAPVSLLGSRGLRVCNDTFAL